MHDISGDEKRMNEPQQSSPSLIGAKSMAKT
jgi:hypothetical protein